MRPTLISIGIFEFHSYAVALALAFLVGVLMPIRENYRLEKPYPATPIVGLWVFLGALIGARAYWILQYDVWTHLPYAVFIWQGGLVFFGGLIGGTLGAMAYLRLNKIPILPAGDIAAPYIPLAHAIGRIGCFLNGCCWGAPTPCAWGVSYPKSRWGAYAEQLKNGLIGPDAATTLPVHPTQLYSVAGLIFLFFVLRYAYKHKKRDGSVLLLYPFLYGILRFSVENFRGDSDRPALGWTVSQWVALGLIAGSIFFWILFRVTIWRKTPPNPPASEGI